MSRAIPIHRLLYWAVLVLAAALLAGCMAASQGRSQLAGAAWRGQNPRSADAFTFVVLSDRTGGHTPGAFERAIAEVNLLQPEFVINVGDMVEGYTTDQRVLDQQWDEIDAMIRNLDAPFFFVAGNHDVQAEQGKANISRPTFVRRHGVNGQDFYSFDFRGCHFVVLDSITADEDKAFAQAQLAWLKQDLERATGASHLFVFFHYPKMGNEGNWNQLVAMLPKDKTTIFNGHTHTLGYDNTQGIASYVLAATGAPSDGPFCMFAQVAVNRGMPTIALIPTGQIRPASLASDVQVLQTAQQSTAMMALAAEGGTIKLLPKNSGPDPLAIRYAWRAPEWTVEPSTADLTIPSQGTGSASFTLVPAHPGAPSPILLAEYRCADGQSVAVEQPVGIWQRGRLGRIEELKLDGQFDEWGNVPAIELADIRYCYQNAKAWQGPADGSARYRAAIAGNALAVAIEVTDDQIATDRDNFWDADAVEICWDVRPPEKRNVPYLSEGSGQIGLVPPAQDGPAGVHWVLATMGAPTPHGVESFCRRTSDGYVMELKIPIRALALEGGTLRDGLVNLGLALDDLDNTPGGPVQKRLSITGAGDFHINSSAFVRLE